MYRRVLVAAAVAAAIGGGALAFEPTAESSRTSGQGDAVSAQLGTLVTAETAALGDARRHAAARAAGELAAAAADTLAARLLAFVNTGAGPDAIDFALGLGVSQASLGTISAVATGLNQAKSLLLTARKDLLARGKAKAARRKLLDADAVKSVQQALKLTHAALTSAGQLESPGGSSTCSSRANPSPTFGADYSDLSVWNCSGEFTAASFFSLLPLQNVSRYGLFGPFGVKPGSCLLAPNAHFVSCTDLTLLPEHTLFVEALKPSLATPGQRLVGDFTGPGGDLRLEFHY